MEQMNVEEALKVEIDYTRPELPASVKKLMPLVFKEGDSYCCVLGPDPQNGVFGCGATADLAVIEWDQKLADHLARTTEDDPVIAYVKAVLNAENTEVW